MRRIWNFICLLLLWLGGGVNAQTSYYRRTYYSPAVAPPTHLYPHSSDSDFVPLTYSSDMHTEESKRKDSAKKYSKKIPFRPYALDDDETSSERYASSEFSNEAHAFNSKDNDNHEYTIGTQIRVQHPITVPKKSTSSHPKYSSHSHASAPYKSSSYQDVNLSDELHESKPLPPPSKKHTHKYKQFFEPDPFHVVPPPKPTSSSGPPSVGYNVYEPDQEDYEAPSSRSKAQLRDRFKGVASKKQIEKYLEDQQKLLDEALKLQLLNNPKYYHLLKSKETEQHFEEGEYEERPFDAPPPPSLYRSNFEENLAFKSNRARRRPQAAELKRSPKSKPPPVAAKPKRRFRSAIVINV